MPYNIRIVHIEIKKIINSEWLLALLVLVPLVVVLLVSVALVVIFDTDRIF
jgi:hypothetical protein